MYAIRLDRGRPFRWSCGGRGAARSFPEVTAPTARPRSAPPPAVAGSPPPPPAVPVLLLALLTRALNSPTSDSTRLLVIGSPSRRYRGYSIRPCVVPQGSSTPPPPPAAGPSPPTPPPRGGSPILPLPARNSSITSATRPCQHARSHPTYCDHAPASSPPPPRPPGTRSTARAGSPRSARSPRSRPCASPVVRRPVRHEARRCGPVEVPLLRLRRHHRPERRLSAMLATHVRTPLRRRSTSARPAAGRPPWLPSASGSRSHAASRRPAPASAAPAAARAAAAGTTAAAPAAGPSL